MTTALTSVTKKEITGLESMQVVRGTCSTGAGGDVFYSRFGSIQSVLISDETNAGAAKATFSGGVVTITATISDIVTLIIFGS